MNRSFNTFTTVFFLSFIGFMGSTASPVLDVAHAQSVVGVWQCRSLSPTPLGMCEGQTILNKDGTYSRRDRCGNLQSWDTGAYKTGEGYIHYEMKDYEPKEYMGKPMTRPKSDTTYFQWVGPNTIRAGSVECNRMQ